MTIGCRKGTGDDIGALFLLEDDERVEAENILIDRLADDGRAAKALVDIRCTRAIPALAERAATSPSATMRDHAARAMAELDTDRGLSALRDRLHKGDVGARLRAVFDLSAHSDPRAEDAAETAAFTDPEPVVRSAALDALFARRGLLPDAESFRSMLDFIKRRALSPAAVRTRGSRGRASGALRPVGGRDSHAGSWVWPGARTARPGRSRSSCAASSAKTPAAESRRNQQLKESGASMTDMHEPPQRFDYARLAGLTGRERKWIEDVLLSELHDDRDAVHAVALLGVQRAIQPLHELLPITEDVPAADIEAALRQLEP